MPADEREILDRVRRGEIDAVELLFEEHLDQDLIESAFSTRTARTMQRCSPGDLSACIQVVKNSLGVNHLSPPG